MILIIYRGLLYRMKAIKYWVNGKLLNKREIMKLYHISFATLNSKLQEFNEDSILLSNWLNSKADKDKVKATKEYIPAPKGYMYKGKLYKYLKDIYIMENVPASYLMGTYPLYEKLGLSREYQVQEYKYCKILREKKFLPVPTLNGLKVGIGGLKHAIVIGNTVYYSISIASSLLKVPDYYISNILKKRDSIDVEKEINGYKRFGRKINVTINGVTYNSAASILKDYRSSYEVIWACLEKSEITGIPFSDVFIQHLNRFAVSYLGKQYTSDNQFCKEMNITYGTLNRLKNKAEQEHRNIDEVLREYLNTPYKRKQSILFLGKKYDTMSQLSKYYGVSGDAIRKSVHQLGSSLSQDKIDMAVTGVIKNTLNRIFINANKSTFNGKLNLAKFKYEYVDETGMTYYTCVFEDGRDEILSNEDLLNLMGYDTHRMREAISYSRKRKSNGKES